MSVSTVTPHPTASTQAGKSGSPNWRTPRLGFHVWLTKALPEPLVLLIYAVLIGVVGGYGAVGFRKLIDAFHYVFFNLFYEWLAWAKPFNVLILPVIGLIVVAIIVKHFAPEAKGHGVPEVMAAIAEKGSIIRPRVVIIKAIASALTIGSGGSVGREGPIVQIGSAFGSSVGQYLHLPERYMRLLVACGAGAGIAATFNAPIGGVMFATEVILGSFALQNFTAIVISSVVSAAIGRYYLGNNPAFPIPVYAIHHAWLFWVFVLLGLATGIFGYVYIRVLYGMEDWFAKLKWTFWQKAAFGGAIVGLIGVFFPQVFGVGYETVDLALTHQLGLWMLLALLILKLVATSVTIAAGGSGGVFSPGLYLGAMLGGTVGSLLALILPHAGINVGLAAVLGMAGVFAASAQAPVTSIMMLFEMTGDYSIILPLMIVSVLGATVASLLSKETIYTLKLVRRGLDITRMRHPDRMKATTVGEALPRECFTIYGSLSVEDAWDEFAKSNHWFAWVRDDTEKLLGSVARAQVLEALNSDERRTYEVQQLLPQEIHEVSERATLSEALSLMNLHSVTYLLVCRGEHPIGVIGSSDIVHAYQEQD